MKKVYYFFAVLILFILQAIYTFNSMGQIRYEEIMESIYSVLLLDFGYIYHGGSTNIGWYGLLLLVYKLFNFSLFTAKYVRLAVQLISLICLGLFLKKVLNSKWFIFVLLTIGLSPVLLFFNTLNLQYGIDLQYLSICLYLISTINFKGKLREYFKHILLGSLAMTAWMSYPVFVFYFPSLIFYYLWSLKRHQVKIFPTSKLWAAFMIFFLAPLIFALLYLKSPQTLLNDPLGGRGIFRGGGAIDLKWSTFEENMRGLFIDLFLQGKSYLMEIPHTDFTNFFPLIALFFIVAASVYLFFSKKYRPFLAIIWITMLSNLILSGLIFDVTFKPGIRRFTPVLASFYALYTINWHYLLSGSLKINWKKIIILILLSLPLHHLMVYPLNLGHLKDRSPNSYRAWFNIKDSPQESFDYLINELQIKDLVLKCQDLDCRNMNVYSVLRGACIWNHLSCRDIYSYDLETQEKFLLNDEFLLKKHVF